MTIINTVGYVFGTGGIWAIPSAAVPTPIRFGTVKNVSVDLKTSEKDLNGQGQIAQAIGVGPNKVSGMIEAAMFDSNTVNQLFFGVSRPAGQITTAMDEPQSVPAASGPYTVTVVHATFFSGDLGVLDANTSVLLTRVSSGPTTGQYSVNTSTGVYTFAAADTLRALLISYQYTIASVGANFAAPNQLMGVRPTFALTLTEPFQGNVLDLTLFACVSTGLSLAFKNEDFTIPKIDFRAFSPANGIFMEWSTNNAQTGSRF
jgi:hypothetical protein